MDKNKLLDLAEKWQEVADWRKSGDEVEVPVTIVRDEYYVDFGVLGEQPIYVEVTDDYCPIAVSDIMDYAPHDPDNLVAELREAIDEKSMASLDDVLGTMVASSVEEDVKLAQVLMAVAEAFRGFPTTAPGAPSALPDTPLPWPGALREDIDYTADDFPLRYQPPPGYAWTSGSSVSVTPDKAVKKTCESMRSAPKRGNMILDNKGRVSWILRDGDDLADEHGRWAVWFNQRDGIPEGTGSFNDSTYPLPIDQSGYVMGEWKDSSGHHGVWVNDSDTETGLRRVQEIRDAFGGEKKKEAFEPPAPVSV